MPGRGVTGTAKRESHERLKGSHPSAWKRSHRSAWKGSHRSAWEGESQECLGRGVTGVPILSITGMTRP